MAQLTTLLFFLCVGGIQCSSRTKLKPVTTLIETKWTSKPLLLEVSEYLAEENPDLFWGYLDSITELEPEFIEYKNDKEYYELILSEASRFVSPAKISILKFALSLRIYSPRIEMYNQMAVDRDFPSNCVAVADVNGQLTCSASELDGLVASAEKSVSKPSKKNERLRRSPEMFKVDHHYPGSHNRSVGVVLYAELGTHAFRTFHAKLKRMAESGKIDYVVRHYAKEGDTGRKIRLSGYGVELQIKSTEYKAQDDTKVKEGRMDGQSMEEEEEDEVEGFVFSKLKSLYPEKRDGLEKLRTHLLESTSEMAPLKVWQLQELSLQAAERIMSSPAEEALKVMTNIAQNFPVMAKSLVRTLVKEELKSEIKANQELFTNSLSIQTSDTALFLNGMFFDLDLTDIISLLETIRQEHRTMESLYNIGIMGPLLGQLLALDLTPPTQMDYGVDIRDSAVLYVNDIENDSQYRRWPDSVMELLRPTFPGMLRNVKKNIYHLVIIADPSKQESQTLFKLAESFYVHNAPLRIGVVFAVNPDKKVSGMDDAGVALLNAFNYISEEKDAYHGLSFITDVYASLSTSGPVTVKDVTKMLQARYSSADVEAILEPDSDYDVGRQLAKDFIERTGLRKMPQVLLNGIPLDEKTLTADEFEETVLAELMRQTPLLQKAVYKGDLLDSTNVVDYLMQQSNIMPRLNERILQTGGEYLEMSGTPAPEFSSATLTTLSSADASATFAKKAKYLTMKTNSILRMLTHWLVVDVETREGRQMLRNALEQLKTTNGIRITAIFNPTAPVDGTISSESFLISRAVHAALYSLPNDVAKQYLDKILQDDAAEAVQSGKKGIADFEVPGLDVFEFARSIKKLDSDFLKTHRAYCAQILKLGPGQRGIITNGRIIAPFEPDEQLTIDDLNLLEKFSMGVYGDKLLKFLKDADDGDENFVTSGERDMSDLAMFLTALLVSRPQTRSRFEIPVRSEEHSVLKIPPRIPGQPAFDITVIVDPVSRGAQKVAPLMSVLHEVLNCKIRVFLNAQEKNSEMPLKSFYRYVLEPEPQFYPDGRSLPGPMARFNSLPSTPILTQNMHVPENWLVEAIRSYQDLDNIRLDDVDTGIHSEFELEYILVEGHCFEQSTGNPPRGLQITLGTNSQPVIVDTIVMANLGYFQLKANPGAWILRLRQGRSADIYEIVSHDNTDTPENSTDIKVVLSSFRSQILKIRVSKKPGKTHLDLLEDDGDKPGIWNSITSTFGGKKDDEEETKLNIFSLASGHLYERFLRIMMLSVVKHTKTPVKFWFLKNYLSPTLKDFLPKMAKKYGFEYELVQYKWPRWLHQQTEKQRIIWGYKILFLDVLFPLDVKKIIFVDADQIVRTDMKELRDFDLGGAPYGYTPFCDSRKEMDGFRFWKQGYWRNHLQGRRYHISALYIVDLRKFRRVAAGDRLRGQYQALSQDPNSLSNLDQDLPNNMIHQVNIKSLPQEWLWCETWCDEDSKKHAKTIDLCNNPLTKEAKLTAAMRIVSEWKDYDDEIKRLMENASEPEEEEEEKTKPIPLTDTHSEL